MGAMLKEKEIRRLGRGRPIAGGFDDHMSKKDQSRHYNKTGC